jgi:hydrogenase expression/formation protein HypD
MDALLAMGEIKIDGFISPGHVSTIIGTEPYEHMDVAQVITGFTSEDILVGIYMLVKQIAEGKKIVENEYKRSVKKQGNIIAQKIISKEFYITSGNWRGFGEIPNSGLEVRNKKLNAKIIYQDILSKMDSSVSNKKNGCRCGEVIRGLIESKQCPMFGKVCTPENPYGPCMVSSEGVCNSSYRFE